MKTTLALIALGTLACGPAFACEIHQTHASAPMDQVAMGEQQSATTVSDQQRADQWKILQDQAPGTSREAPEK
jgi:hypothetical protein